MKEELKEILELLGGRECFLVGGAALWAYRDKEFTPCSFGIGVWGLQGQEDLHQKLEEAGFTMQRVMGSVVQATKTKQFMVFFLQKEGNEWYSYRHHVGHYLSVPDKFHKLEKITFKGLRLNVPSPIEDYLLWTYGEKWADKTQTNKSYPPARCSKE